MDSYLSRMYARKTELSPMYNIMILSRNLPQIPKSKSGVLHYCEKNPAYEAYFPRILEISCTIFCASVRLHTAAWSCSRKTDGLSEELVDAARMREWSKTVTQRTRKLGAYHARAASRVHPQSSRKRPDVTSFEPHPTQNGAGEDHCRCVVWKLDV